MTFDTAKTIAAFGGLGLGLLNLAITIYKEFIKSSKLGMEIETAKIRYITAGEYQFQLNLSFSSKNGASYIKDIFLKHPTSCIGDYSHVNIINLNKSIPYTNRDLLENSPDEFKPAILKLFENSIKVRDLKIEDNGRVSLTFADRIITRRDMDGYEDFPLGNWTAIVDYGNKTLSIPFKWSPHSKSTDGYWGH